MELFQTLLVLFETEVGLKKILHPGDHAALERQAMQHWLQGKPSLTEDSIGILKSITPPMFFIVRGRGENS